MRSIGGCGLMPGYWGHGRTRRSGVQDDPCVWRLNVCAAALLAGLLGGCSDTLSGPIDLFHDLEGGQIAAQRPPPPGAGLPYPNLGSVPAKPALPDPAFRNGLQAQLLAERDRTERLAADAPIQALPPPPPPPPPPAAAQNTAAAQNGGVAPATATLDTVEAPARVQAPAAPAVPQPRHHAGRRAGGSGVRARHARHAAVARHVRGCLP